MVYWEAEPGGLEKNASVSPNLRCYQKKGLGILESRAREQRQEGWRKCVSYPSSAWVPGVLGAFWSLRRAGPGSRVPSSVLELSGEDERDDSARAKP